jgi:hypothetical protein
MDLQQSMLLWLPINKIDSHEDESLFSNLTAANGHVLDFWDGKCSLDETLMAIEYYGANPDDYRAMLDANLRYFGG